MVALLGIQFKDRVRAGVKIWLILLLWRVDCGALDGGLYLISLPDAGDHWKYARERDRRRLSNIASTDPSLFFSTVHHATASSCGGSGGMAVDAQARFHVLAVDDSLIDRKLIERLLKISSYQVTTVDSGSKALEVLGLREEQEISSPASPEKNEIEVNLVITDYCMPGMTGYDLLKKIKGSSSLKDIPVVIMSSENVPSRINRCLEGGAEGFFLKPIQPSDMMRLRPYLRKGKKGEQQQSSLQQEDNNSQCSSSSSCSSNKKRKTMTMDDDELRPRLSSTGNLTLQ